MKKDTRANFKVSNFVGERSDDDIHELNKKSVSTKSHSTYPVRKQIEAILDRRRLARDIFAFD